MHHTLNTEDTMSVPVMDGSDHPVGTVELKHAQGLRGALVLNVRRNEHSIPNSTSEGDTDHSYPLEIRIDREGRVTFEAFQPVEDAGLLGAIVDARPDGFVVQLGSVRPEVTGAVDGGQPTVHPVDTAERLGEVRDDPPLW